MIIGFFNQGTEDIYNGVPSKLARKTLPSALWRVAQRKLYFLENAINIEDLRIPPSNHLEKLQGDRVGQYAIRINQQYRICFNWTSTGITAVEIVDYH